MDIHNGKIVYDTEFSAERAVAIMEHKEQQPFHYYRCGNHFHISHKRQSGRNKYPKPIRTDYCEFCDQIVPVDGYGKHRRTAHHKANVKGQV